MTRIVGVKQVTCTCGREMFRTGGQFGGKVTLSTYYCEECHKAVNVVDLPEKEVKEMEEVISKAKRFKHIYEGGY